MNLNATEELVFAYWLEHGAQDFAMVGRFFPYGELTLLIQDKVQVAVRRFGVKAIGASPGVARAFLDELIERGAFSTTKNKFGGSMHQYQPDAYKAALQALRAADPVVARAASGGPGFWDEAFAG
jgi:hypothetical protein